MLRPQYNGARKQFTINKSGVDVNREYSQQSQV